MPAVRPLRVVVACTVLLVGASLPPDAAAGGGSGTKDLDGAVNLNTATPDELALLPGVGPAKVRSIVAYRRKHPFRTPEELVRIKGIGRKMVRRLRAHIVVVGLTTAQAVRHKPADEPPPAPPTPQPRPGARPAAGTTSAPHALHPASPSGAARAAIFRGRAKALHLTPAHARANGCVGPR